MLSRAGDGGGGGWLKSAFSVAKAAFGGERASGGETRAGSFYTTVEHGRPELVMLSGQGHVLSNAETAKMIAGYQDDRRTTAEPSVVVNCPRSTSTPRAPIRTA
ncbi:hypothetical protein E4M02_14190 [Brevundimonas sp. S30B]|nr:hypothetical protein E4M01_08105 [Brevundimonas sp. MF30-B]TFW00596.1 hypothetical protein E4M02_14190 [Brevundimonas sp. S30B]